MTWTRLTMWEAAAQRLTSAHSPSSFETPRQRQITLRAASSLGPPASASLGQFGRGVLAGRPHRPCSPRRHHACDQRARRVFPLQAGHVQAARRRRRQRLRPERLSRPRAPLTRRGHGQLWRVPARIDPPSPRRGWTGSRREGRRAHLLGDAARARVRPAAPPRHVALPAAGPPDRAQLRQHLVRLACRRHCVAQCGRDEVTPRAHAAVCLLLV